MSEGPTRSERPRVGVSSCLLGLNVRYDGTIKGIPWVAGELAAQVELVPICPETGAGMPVPRPPVQLVEHRVKGLRVSLVEGRGDVHTALEDFCSSMRQELEAHGLHGYLFKARSPSCGVTDTPHFSETGDVMRYGAGLWAQSLMTRWPTLPIVDESQVQTAEDKAEFLRRVHAYWREDSPPKEFLP